MRTTPILIRRYEPDPERCVATLARLLGLSAAPASIAPITRITVPPRRPAGARKREAAP